MVNKNSVLDIDFIKKYQLDNSTNKQNATLKIEQSISLEKHIEKAEENDWPRDYDRKLDKGHVDELIYSGKFNSVLGPDGIKKFRESIWNIVKKENKGEGKSNLINLSDLFELLMESGVYYESGIIEDVDSIVSEYPNVLTAYRYIVKNFENIEYKEYREITKSLQKYGGDSLSLKEIQLNSKLLKKIRESSLLESAGDAKSILESITLSDIRNICKEIGVSSKRSKAETIEHLLSIPKAIKQIETKFENKANSEIVSIRDIDLVRGEHIVVLDKYLRELSKHIREEVLRVINEKRQRHFAA